MTQNPFSFYDFLGYLIPGGLFLFILFLFSIEINPVYIEGILNHILKYKEIISVFIYVVLIVLSYISGHFISILSSCLIEKYMNSKLGYPSIYLFSKRSSLKIKRHNTKFSIVNFIRGVFLFPVNVKFTGFLYISYLKNRDKFSDKNSGQDNNYKKRVDINNKHLYLHVF